MSKEDLAFAVNITDTMSWDLIEEDFKFMMKLEPEGCFVLLNGSERVGIATTISYGRIGWLGNLIISENHRKKGAGALMVRHALEYLKKKNVETVGLYAYIHTIPFYEKIGFQYDSEFTVLEGEGRSSPPQTAVTEIRQENLQRIIDFDKLCLGASRKKLLEPILRDSNNPGYISTRNGEITGYAATKVYNGTAEVGPLVCLKEHDDVAINLLKATLLRLEGHHVSMCIPRKEFRILTLLKDSGFDEKFYVARMFCGYPFFKDCIHLAESLERG